MDVQKNPHDLTELEARKSLFLVWQSYVLLKTREINLSGANSAHTAVICTFNSVISLLLIYTGGGQSTVTCR